MIIDSRFVGPGHDVDDQNDDAADYEIEMPIEGVLYENAQEYEYKSPFQAEPDPGPVLVFVVAAVDVGDGFHFGDVHHEDRVEGERKNDENCQHDGYDGKREVLSFVAVHGGVVHENELSSSVERSDGSAVYDLEGDGGDVEEDDEYHQPEGLEEGVLPEVLGQALDSGQQ